MRPYRWLYCQCRFGGNHETAVIDLRKARGVVAYWVRGERKIIDLEHVFPMRGWNPRHQPSWFLSPFINAFPSRTALALYEAGRAEPIDRTQDQDPYITPLEYRAFVRSPLYKRYRAKKFGPTAPWMLIAIILIVLMAFMAVLYFGGYYG